jgi:hypothetical protein
MLESKELSPHSEITVAKWLAVCKANPMPPYRGPLIFMLSLGFHFGPRQLDFDELP